MRCILLTYLIYMNTHLHNLLLPVSQNLSLFRNRVCSDVFMIQPYYGRWPQFHIILFRRQTCEKPMWWHLGPQRLSRVMSLQALGAQRLPASYWRLGWGQGGLPYKSERSTTLQKPWSQNPVPRLTVSIVTSTRFVSHYRSTKPSRCVWYKFDFSFKMKAQLSSQRSQSCGLYTVFTLSGCGWRIALK